MNVSGIAGDLGRTGFHRKRFVSKGSVSFGFAGAGSLKDRQLETCPTLRHIRLPPVLPRAEAIGPSLHGLMVDDTASIYVGQSLERKPPTFFILLG
jgi:hypothetical protein